MNQSKRIDPLLKRAQEHEDAVARDLAERQRVLDTHLSRLDELRRYAEEYANAQMAATSPAQLLNRRAFLDRLDSAVEQQQATVNGNREKVEAERARLILASRDKAVLEQLAASYRAQEKVVTDRRDQREMDDIGRAARAWCRPKTRTAPSREAARDARPARQQRQPGHARHQQQCRARPAQRRRKGLQPAAAGRRALRRACRQRHRTDAVHAQPAIDRRQQWPGTGERSADAEAATAETPPPARCPDPGWTRHRQGQARRDRGRPVATARPGRPGAGDADACRSGRRSAGQRCTVTGQRRRRCLPRREPGTACSRAGSGHRSGGRRQTGGDQRGRCHRAAIAGDDPARQAQRARRRQ
jgi:flagellar FliJ protein